MRKLTMTKFAMTMTLLAVVASPAAIAQRGTRPDTSKGPWPAPVGHRQPRVDQVPSEKDMNDPNNAVSREDAALDRSIKSICRGC